MSYNFSKMSPNIDANKKKINRENAAKQQKMRLIKLKDKSVRTKVYNCSSTTSFRAPPTAPSTSCSRTNSWSGSGSGSGNNCTCNGFPPLKIIRINNQNHILFSVPYLHQLASLELDLQSLQLN